MIIIGMCIMSLLPLTSNLTLGVSVGAHIARLLSFQCLCMRFNFSQAAFSPLHKQSVGGLLSTSLVAKWTFLCVAPLAFALTNTGALTRGWGPRQGCWSSVWYGLLRVWSPSTHIAVAEQTNLSMVSVVFVLYTVYIYICMHQQTYTLSLLHRL